MSKKIFETNTIDKGAKVLGYAIKSKKPMTKKQVEERVTKIKNALIGNFNIQVCVNTDVGPRSGQTFSNFSNVELCDDYEWATTQSFAIYVWKNNDKKGGCDDEHNDCLFDCIRDIVGVYKMPKDYKTPESLKEYLGIERDDLIDIDDIRKIEKLYKININVTGDSVYTSANKYPTRQIVNIVLSNNHYELNEELITTGNLGRAITKRQYKLVLCDEQQDYVMCYDGDCVFKIGYTAYYKEKRNARETGNSYINEYDKKMPLQEAYNKMVIDSQKLLELTKGKYDLSRAMWKVPELMRRILANALIGYDEPEPITEMEQHWIYHTHCNAIIFSSKCELDNAIAYDKNSCYPSVLCDSKFTFPVKQGVFMQIDKMPEILQFGIYRVIIARSGDEMTDRWFRFNEENYYTHHNIKNARLLGLSITLINDGEANALLYTTKRAIGQNYFEPVVKELYNIKKKSDLAKPLLSCMWGMMCSKYIIKRSTAKAPVELTTEKLVSLQQIGETNSVVVSYMKANKYYKYDYARLGVFLTSYNRLKMTELLHPHNEHIHRFHTDGFVSDTTLDLDIGTGLGQWKVDKTGPCQINNCNNVIWA